jgi:hypothetical protein
MCLKVVSHGTNATLRPQHSGLTEMPGPARDQRWRYRGRHAARCHRLAQVSPGVLTLGPGPSQRRRSLRSSPPLPTSPSPAHRVGQGLAGASLRWSSCGSQPQDGFGVKRQAGWQRWPKATGADDWCALPVLPCVKMRQAVGGRHMTMVSHTPYLT